MDDVKAAFRVFDCDNNGSIRQGPLPPHLPCGSKEELREAMVNLGQRCTEE
jgi:Ca2+-binding EF-hand superfamily protein